MAIVFKCKMCGGDLNITEGSPVCECEYCGTKQTVPALDNEKKTNLFNRANKLRFNNEFDEAANVFGNIVAEFPEESEAYWGLCLCRYGIEYVEDPVTHERKPTCHRASFDSIFDDDNFKQACENSESVSRKVYREEAKEIDRIRQSILDIAKNEKPYDIFICYKETDENGERTKDSVIAQDMYTALTKEGYKVFFARITLEDKLGQEYEPYIFSALSTAKIMLALGTDYEYFNAVWVKNEWARFLEMRRSHPEKVLIPCYADIDAYDMPKEFKNLQGQDMGKVGFMQDLVRGIGKILKPASETSAKPTIINRAAGTNIENLLKRGNMALENREWNEARSFFNRVLDENAEEADAHLGLLLADMESASINEMSGRFQPVPENVNYKNALRYGSESMCGELRKCSEQINRNYNGALNKAIGEKNNEIAQLDRQVSGLDTEIRRLENGKVKYRKSRAIIPLIFFGGASIIEFTTAALPAINDSQRFTNFASSSLATGLIALVCLVIFLKKNKENKIYAKSEYRRTTIAPLAKQQDEAKRRAAELKKEVTELERLIIRQVDQP